MHDIGLHAVRNDDGEVGFKVLVGGGLGRTPMIGHVIREFLPWRHLLTYLEAILRVYNRYGRRDNIYKARIKILVKERGPERFREEVEAEWAHLKDGPGTLTEAEVAAVGEPLHAPRLREALVRTRFRYASPARADRPLRAWHKRNVHPHKVPGYAAVTLSLKKTGVPPGDVTARPDGRDRRSRRALLLRRAARHARAEPGARRRARSRDLPRSGTRRCALGLATPNIGLLTNIICCPGGDFCALANAKSIPVARGDPASASTTSTTCTTSASSTSTSPAA